MTTQGQATAVLSRLLGLLAADAAPPGVLVDDEVLQRLSVAAADLLAVDAVGVMLDDRGRLRSAAGSAGVAHEMQQAQERLVEGPCHDAVRTRAPVVAVDLERAGQWPRYAPAALAAGVRSVASVPVLGRGRALAAMDLLRTAPAPFDQHQLELARTLADVAATYLLMAQDRRDAEHVRHELARRALYDELTGLPNRALLHDRLVHELAVSHRSGGALAVLFVDIDRFKDVNDTLGHDAGDTLLVEVGRRLTAATRSADTVARLGGDEFVVVCPDLTPSPREAADGSGVPGYVQHLAQRLRQSLAAPVRLRREDVVISASIGAAIAGPEHRDPGDLLRDADAAMYAVKRRRGQVAVVDLRDTMDRQSRLSTARDLREAVGLDQLRLDYQPVVGLRGQVDEHLEALLRWQHPVRGLLSPDAFLPVAESTGLAVDIGWWVLGQVCAFAVRWQPTSGSTVAVNVSGSELAEPAFAERVLATLQEHGLPPHRLRLELTENVLLDPDSASVRVVSRLRAAGVCVSLDDFGTGFSSLSHLERFDVDTLKIDQVFTRRLFDRRGRGIVAGVIGLARALDLDVVAEGVEHPEQRELLRRLGCDFAQGWLMGRPRSAESVLADP